MASVVGICNSALIKLGASTIMSLTEGTKNANLCNEQYGKLRDELLRAHNWNFAMKRQKLAQLSTAPVYGFTYAYQIPADWIRTVAVHDNDAGTGLVRYQTAGLTVESDASSLWMRYVCRVTDPNLMDTLYREALSWSIATDLAVSIPDSTTAREDARKGFESAIRKAQSVDAIEDFPEAQPESDWVGARY